MASSSSSSSSGDGPSTSGRRRYYELEEQHLDFASVPVINTRPSNMELRALLLAVSIPDPVRAKNAANKLKRMGMSLDKAVKEEASDNPNSDRLGPLHVAVMKKHKKICKMLVEEFECDPNATTAHDETPLYFAIEGGSRPLVEYLITFGADPNKADKRGITPLHHAAQRGYCEIADYLLSNGANVDQLCKDGEAPLHVAALYRHAKMVKLLSDHNANLNILSHWRHTPLVYSVFGSSLECLQTLIQEGADINIDKPVTPLSVAARKGLVDCTNCLLNNNADANELNEDGKLPLEIAASKGWVECFEILRPRTKPLQKYANLGTNQIIQQEVILHIVEEYMVIGEGDFAFWEKEYTHALGCYSLALKLGHGDPSLYAKRSLCYMHNHDRLRYSDDARYYEEETKKSVSAFLKEWRASYLADQASRDEHPLSEVGESLLHRRTWW